VISRMTVGLALAPLAVCPLFACTESELVQPATQSLQTDMDQVALRADIGPFVAEWLTALTSSTPTDGVQVGRPYGCFAIEKGPRLVFGDFWRAPVLTGTRYQAMADVQDEGDTYVIVGIGAAEVADLLGEREKLSALSSALDQERAGSGIGPAAAKLT